LMFYAYLKKELFIAPRQVSSLKLRQSFIFQRSFWLSFLFRLVHKKGFYPLMAILYFLPDYW